MISVMEIWCRARRLFIYGRDTALALGDWLALSLSWSEAAYLGQTPAGFILSRHMAAPPQDKLLSSGSRLLGVRDISQVKLPVYCR